MSKRCDQIIDMIDEALSEYDVAERRRQIRERTFVRQLRRASRQEREAAVRAIRRVS